jgi:Ni/Co efflux regulator RcnB
MSVPLDRLYHYLADCVNHDLLIYRWNPHGSRKLEDLDQLITYTPFQNYYCPMMICHDQEPLVWNFYTREQIKARTKQVHATGNPAFTSECALEYMADQYLRSVTICPNHFDQTLLLHSEQNSVEVARFEQAGFVPVYYWSHAVIAQDWFRYAEHDPKLHFDWHNIKQDFLVYNRAWAGTREYRLCFTEQMVDTGLSQHCKMLFSAQDNGAYYSQHQFANPDFQITNSNLQDFFQTNTHSATASADYCNEDYASTGIEVVLETLFDDTRWHLTEKTLRPIACGKPFVLAATPGSLQYLQNYGFETFAGLIDESYDAITDGRARLNAIVAELKKIATLDADAKQVLYTKLHEIAQRNKQRFFNGLFDQVIEEYNTNLDHAMNTMQQHCTGRHHSAIQQLI